MSLYLSTSLSLCLLVLPSLCLSFCPSCLYDFLPLNLSVSFSLDFSFFLPVLLSVCPSVCLPLCVCLCPSLSLSRSLSVSFSLTLSLLSFVAFSLSLFFAGVSQHDLTHTYVKFKYHYMTWHGKPQSRLLFQALISGIYRAWPSRAHASSGTQLERPKPKPFAIRLPKKICPKVGLECRILCDTVCP